MDSLNIRYRVVSEYSGEQGHLGGGDLRVHVSGFFSAEEAFEWIDKHQRELMYRDYRVEATR
jgi:hypothetical protein